MNRKMKEAVRQWREDVPKDVRDGFIGRLRLSEYNFGVYFGDKGNALPYKAAADLLEAAGEAGKEEKLTSA